MLALAHGHVTSEYEHKSQEKLSPLSQQKIPEKAMRPSLLSSISESSKSLLDALKPAEKADLSTKRKNEKP